MVTTLGQQAHDVLATPSGTEAIEQAVVLAMREFLGEHLAPSVKARFTALSGEGERGAAQQLDREAIRRRMIDDPVFQVWSSLRRATQEALWSAVDRSIDRQAEELGVRIERLAADAFDPASAGGDLPEYLHACEIHCMPYGYEGPPGDRWRVGAFYDRGVYLYTMGQLGPLNDNLAHAVLAWLSDARPGLSPERIVDLGCTVGHRTLPYAQRYESAQILGIDVSEPAVRYAAARARALGVSNARFRAGDARATNLPDGSADLVVSHLLLHEMPLDAVVDAVAESWRLVAEGGLVIHADYGQYDGADAFREFMLDWDTVGNNEPFWGGFRSSVLEAIAEKAGVPADALEIVKVPVARRLQTGEGRKGSTELTLLSLRKDSA